MHNKCRVDGYGFTLIHIVVSLLAGGLKTDIADAVLILIIRCLPCAAIC